MSEFKTSEIETPRTFGQLDTWLALAIFASLLLTLLAQVVSRYAFNSPLGWTEELARYLLILLTFTGAAMGFRRNTHISFLYFQRYFVGGLSKVIPLAIAISNTLFIIFLIALSWEIATLLEHHEMTSLPYSIQLVYWCVGLSLSLCLVRSIQWTINVSRSWY